jgi:hypothetical protein
MLGLVVKANAFTAGQAADDSLGLTGPVGVLTQFGLVADEVFPAAATPAPLGAAEVVARSVTTALAVGNSPNAFRGLRKSHVAPWLVVNKSARMGASVYCGESCGTNGPKMMIPFLKTLMLKSYGITGISVKLLMLDDVIICRQD